MANPLLWFNPYYLKHKNFSSVFSRHFVFSHVILCFLTSFCVFYCCKLLILLAKNCPKQDKTRINKTIRAFLLKSFSPDTKNDKRLSLSVSLSSGKRLNPHGGVFCKFIPRITSGDFSFQRNLKRYIRRYPWIYWLCGHLSRIVLLGKHWHVRSVQ